MHIYSGRALDLGWIGLCRYGLIVSNPRMFLRDVRVPSCTPPSAGIDCAWLPLPNCNICIGVQSMVRAIRFSIWFPVYVCWFLEIGIHSHVYNRQ